MNVSGIIGEIDSEIARLTRARALLSNIGTSGKSKATAPARKRRTLSAKARKAIADAQRKRWAAVRAKAKAK